MTQEPSAFNKWADENLPQYKGDEDALLARGAALLAWRAAIAASHKPVSLEKCAKEAYYCGKETPYEAWCDISYQHLWIDKTKAVLDAAGVAYVD